MKLLDVLKPDIGTVAITTLLLMSSGAILHIGVTCVEGGIAFGFPLTFFTQCNDIGPQGVTPGAGLINPIAAAIDIAVWYAVVAFVAAGMRKLKPRPGEQTE
jgi:hypothetical protein